MELKRKPQSEMKDHGSVRTLQWRMCLPFLVNPRAKLVHRVLSARTYTRDGKWSHDVATYWCGNNGRGEFVADPPIDCCARTAKQRPLRRARRSRANLPGVTCASGH